MLKTIFSVFVKVLFALGAVFAVLAVLRRYDERKSHYIEIYNDCQDDDDEEDYYL